MDLIALGDFDAVARHGGFGPASRATGLPKATLSRRVRALEAELGVRLVERGARVLRLTEEGEALHRRSGALVAELAEIGEEVANASGAPRGRLRVNVPAMLAGAVLGGVAARFVAAYPAVRLEIVSEDRFVDPVADGYDVVVRANPPTDSALVGQCIRRDSYVVAAHPDVACPKTTATPVQVDAVLQLSAAEGDVWRVERAGGLLLLHPRAAVRASSVALVRGAVLGGAGAGMFPRALVAADLAAGTLVEWGNVPERRVELWALHTSRRLASTKVRLFVETLRETFAPA